MGLLSALVLLFTIAGIVLLIMAAFNKTGSSVSYGWGGAACLAVAWAGLPLLAKLF